MSTYRPRSAEAIPPSATFLPGNDGRLCDKMDADSDWEWQQQPETLEREGVASQVARSFEFDVHDCSVSEIHR